MESASVSGMAPGDAWRSAVDRVLKGAEFADALVTRNRDGILLGPLFQNAGQGAPWPWRDTAAPIVVIQRMDHPDLEEANRLAKADIGNGATGLVLAFADAATARSFGLSVATSDDVARALDAMPLDSVRLRCEFPPVGAERLLDPLFGGIERSGHRAETLDIDAGIDSIGAVARTGAALRGEARDAQGAAALMTETAARWLGLLESRGVRPALQADGRPYHEAGASEAQELAAVLASGVAGLRAAEQAGIDLARLSISFTLVADADQLLTTAKFRAFRRLWARVEQQCSLKPKPARLHGETAWRMLTRLDPWSNPIRTTIACAGAILGGADSVTVLPFTSALGLPDAFARRLARNTALVLLEEAKLDRVADPCAGSGAFEGVTGALCQEAWRLFQGLDAGGGLAAALATGTWQARIAATRDERHSDLASGKSRIVRSAASTHDAGVAPPVLRPAPAIPGGESVAGPWAVLPSFRDAEDFEAEHAIKRAETPPSEGTP